MTVNQIQTARTINPKENFCALGGGVYKSEYNREEKETKYSFPLGGIYYRRGLIDSLDAGLKIVNLFTFGVDLKYQLLYGDIEIASGLALGYASISQIDVTDTYKSKFYDLSIPTYFTFNFNEYVSTTLTPSLLFRQISESTPSNSRQLLYVGGSYALKLGTRFGVMWVVGYYKPIYTKENLEIDKKPLKEMNFAFFWNFRDSDINNKKLGEMNDLEKIETFTPEEYEFLKEK